MRKNITKLLFIIILVVVAIGITGCQSQVPCSIEVTSPGNWESLNGNLTHQITWDWVGSSNEKVNIILIGYTQSQEEMGTMLIDSNVFGADGSYLWGPNFGDEIWTSFEDWPWWFRIGVEVVESDVYGISDFFSVSMWN